MYSFTLLPLLQMACQVPGPTYSGHGTYDYFAFDGSRTWKYQSEDENTPYTLVVEKTDYNYADGIETITFEYSTEDPQALLGSITWTTGGIIGTSISSYSTSEEEIVFDTPVTIAENRMIPDDIVETSTNGATFTSTFTGLEMCPNNWTTDEWECLHFVVTVDQAEHNYPFVGEYWLANGWGASRFIAEKGSWASAAEWVLIGATWENE